ncbi:MAG: hypothetical protein Q4C52_13040 [Eubacteriales bacterium]|nr:hypothetical protein [Eubacteriales bacterium]
MAISNDKYYKPDEALYELMIQENIINIAVDAQATLRILVDKGIVSREEVNGYRNEVRNSPKYRLAIEDIRKQKEAFQAAKNNPEEYLRAMFKAKMDDKLK